MEANLKRLMFNGIPWEIKCKNWVSIADWTIICDGG